jgi:hypothetical protein
VFEAIGRIIVLVFELDIIVQFIEDGLDGLQCLYIC